MRDNSLRLRLVVRRHSLPEVRIIHHVPLENDPTIADLVDQINDIIPLESPEWGLEDYVVELRNKEGYAFECLHFQQVANVLKDEEEVFVRPLVTGDRKRRLLSGREQISNDGRHLIDGVPFGRPRLRSPRDRPPVDIPPLKRRRIAYDTIEHDDDEQAEPLFLTRNGEPSEDRESTRLVRFNYAGNDENEDEEEDDDFVDQEQLDDEEEEEEGEDEGDDYEINPDELADELEGLQEAESREETPAGDNIEQPVDISPTKSQRSIDLSDIDRIAALRAAFPRVSVDVCEKLLLKFNSNERKVYWKLRRRNRSQMTLEQMLAYKRRLQVRGPDAAMEDELEEEAEASEKSDVESVDSLTKHYDEHGFPAGSILDGSANRHMVEALRMSGQDVKLPTHKKFDDDEEEEDEGPVQPAKVAAQTDENEIPLDSDGEEDESDFNVDLDDDEDLSEQEPDSSTDSDAVSLSDNAGEVLDEEDPNEPSDEESAASDSESGPEVYTTKVKPPAEMVAPKSPQPNDESSSSDESDSDSTSDDDTSSEEDASSNESESDDDEEDSSSDSSSSNSSDSGSYGNSSADNANANFDNNMSSDSESNSSGSNDDEPLFKRPKNANNTKAVFQPISQQTATLDTATLDASSASNEQQDQGPVPPGQGKNKTRMRNKRRRLSAKMRKTASRDTSIIGQDAETSMPADLEAKRMALLQSLGHLEYLGKPAEVEKPAVPVTETEKPEASVADTTSASAKRKSKLDVDAGRRMLFGSLGLKNPKSQEDEEKVRASLMKGVKPLVNHRVEDAKKDIEVTVTEVDPDAWRQKINYTAVECTEEGVELSEPPFPFYQRWDPQQQNYWKSGRGGALKRKQHDEEEYEEEEPGAKKRKVSDEEKNVVLNYDEEDPDAYEAQDHHEEEQNEEEYEEEEYDEEEHEDEEEDLPPLPADLTTLPQLQPGQAKVGMVITWKQFLLSKATNWQPQVMNMTGTVVEVWDGNDLRILLAKRDRNLDKNEKVYDDEGNRVYDKFEIPEDEDDTDEDAEKGYRTINFADMMEPWVLRQSEDEVLVPETQHQGNITLVNEDGASKASSRTLDHKAPSEPESQTAQDSLIPATDHGSSYEPQAAQVTSADNALVDDALRPEPSLVGTGSRPEADASGVRDEPLNVSNPSPQPVQAPEPSSSPQHGPSAPPSEGHNTPPRTSVLGDELPDVTDLPSQEPESQDPQRPPSHSSAYLESQRITLGPFNGFFDGLEQAANNWGNYVSYARFDVIPSDTGSVRSERQPDSEFSIGLGNNEILDRFEPVEEEDVPMMGGDDGDDVSVAESDPEEHEEEEDEDNEDEDHQDIDDDQGDNEEEDQQDNENNEDEEDDQEDDKEGSRQSTPKARKRTLLSEEHASPALSNLSASTDDSFPSLSQTTTKSSQRRASQQTKSVPGDAVPNTSQTRKLLDAANLAYEQVMKRLDEEGSSQESTTIDNTQIKLEKRRQLSELAHKLAKTPIERPPPRKLPFRRTSTPSKLDQTATATKSTKNTRFVIPEGSQVVDLLSSSPELNEYYADDDVDETYHDSSPATSQSQHRAPPSTAPKVSASFVTPRSKLFGSTRLSSTQLASPRRSQPSIITGSLRKNRGSASSSK